MPRTLIPLLGVLTTLVPLRLGICQEDHPGFPIVLGSDAGHPAVADLDGDGTLEVIVASGSGPDFVNGVHAYHHDGTVVEGWPYEPDDWWSNDRPRVGDIDSDGSPEVVVRMVAGKIHVLRADGEIMPPWPLEPYEPSWYRIYGLGDLDGDGDMEIVILEHAHPPKLYAFHGDATSVDGWPVGIAPDIDYDELYFAEMAVGDLDFDGSAEIVTGAYAYNDSTQLIPTPVTVYNGDGSIRAGWPKNLTSNTEHDALLYPAIADLDGDYHCEIIGSSNSADFLLDANGGYFFAPRKHVGLPRPNVAADLDGDGDLEVIVPKDTLRIHDFREADPLAETDSSTYWAFDGVSAGDVDGDGSAEIAAWSFRYDQGGPLQSRHALHLYDSELNELPGWPLEQYRTFDFTSTLLADLDADGDLELVFTDQRIGSRDVLHVLDIDTGTSGSKPARVEWQSTGGDGTYGNYYHSGRAPRQVLLRGDGNLDASVDIADAGHMLAYTFQDGECDCPVAYDLDADGELGLDDAIALLDYLFLGGAPPRTPYPTCGYKPTDEILPCVQFVCPPEVGPRAAGPTLSEPRPKHP